MTAEQGKAKDNEEKPMAGMQISGQEIFQEENDQPKVTKESDVFGQEEAQKMDAAESKKGKGGNKPDNLATSAGDASEGEKTAKKDASQPDATADLPQNVGEAYQQVTEKVTEKALSFADDSKQKLAAGVHGFADKIRQLGTNLSAADESGALLALAANYGEIIAQQVEKLSEYVEKRDWKDLTNDVQNLARRNPTAFVSGAFLIGLLGARFLRASPPRQLSKKVSANKQKSASNSALPPMKSAQTDTGVTA